MECASVRVSVCPGDCIEVGLCVLGRGHSFCWCVRVEMRVAVQGLCMRGGG